MARNTDSGRGSGSNRKSFGRKDDRGRRSNSSFDKKDEGDERPRRKSASDLGFTKKSKGERTSNPKAKEFRADKRVERKDDSRFDKKKSGFGKRQGRRFEKDEERRPDRRRTGFGKRDDQRLDRQGESRAGKRPGFGKRDEQRFSKPGGKRDEQRFGRPGGKRYEKQDEKSAAREFRKKSAKEPRSFVQSRVESSSRAEYKNTKSKPTNQEQGLTRLNKYIANAGVGSRREADELIKMGLISVNGKTVTEMGFKVKEGDVVRYENKILKAEAPVYILLNKPKGFITTTDDPQERNTVMHLVAKACKERVYPVGRLDRNTTGLLLLTNDGDLADKLTHPSYNVKKVYKVELNRPLTKNDFQKIMEGVQLEEGRAMVDDLAIVSDDKKTVGIELHIGWNRIVRRIFEALEYEVLKLDRVVYAGLDKKDLPRGHWRFLKSEEIVRLKHFS